MRRAEKIALLTSVLESATTDDARQRLEQAVANTPRSIVLIDDLDYTGPSLTDASLVQFQVKGQRYETALGDVNRYARRLDGNVLLVNPARPLV